MTSPVLLQRAVLPISKDSIPFPEAFHGAVHEIPAVSVTINLFHLGAHTPMVLIHLSRKHLRRRHAKNIFSLFFVALLKTMHHIYLMNASLVQNTINLNLSKGLQKAIALFLQMFLFLHGLLVPLNKAHPPGKAIPSQPGDFGPTHPSPAPAQCSAAKNLPLEATRLPQHPHPAALTVQQPYSDLTTRPYPRQLAAINDPSTPSTPFGPARHQSDAPMPPPGWAH